MEAIRPNGQAERQLEVRLIGNRQSRRNLGRADALDREAIVLSTLGKRVVTRLPVETIAPARSVSPWPLK